LLEQSENLNIRDHMKATCGVMWSQNDHKERGPEYSENSKKMSMNDYVR
jgi:hypothetical protein